MMTIKGVQSQRIPLRWLTRLLEMPKDGEILSLYVHEGEVVVTVASEEYDAPTWEGATA